MTYMLLALLDLYLALEFKGFSQWEPKTRALVAIVGGIIILAISISFIRKVGIIAIIVPILVFGSIFVMSKNSGCLEKAGEVQEEGTYKKGQTKPMTMPAK